MNLPRHTIARWMVLTAIFAVNAAVVRAFFVHEMFYGGILMFFVLQLGLWRLIRTRATNSRFWLGFELSGSAAVLALFSCEFFPGSPLARLESAYIEIASDLTFRQVPALLPDGLLDEHWDLFLAVVYFVPELVAAMLGGVSAVLLFGSAIWSHSRASDAR